MKTIKQLLITIAVLLCSATASAYDFEVDGIYYNILSISDLTVQVTAGENKYSGEVIIPSTVSYKSKTLTVTSIGGYAFYKCDGLTSVIIGNSVTSIGDYAFYECDGLTSVIIGNSVTSIGERAFEYCSGLTSVIIGNSVTSIGKLAFYECKGLKTVINLSYLTLTKLSDKYGYVAYYANKVINVPNGDIVDDFIFSTSDNKHTLANYFGSKNVIILPEDYNGDSYAIGNSAFYECKGLTSITIPNSVTSIGERAFSSCSSLTSVTIPNSVTSIGERAFSYCHRLTSVTIGNNVTSIGDYAFGYSDELTSIYLLGKTPPTAYISSFTNKQYLNTRLYVPQGSLATYQSADTWKEFWDIQEFDATGIENIEEVTPAFEITSSGIQFTAADGEAISIYAANGALVENIGNYAGEEITLDKGVYIVRVRDKTMKVKL